MTPEDFRAQLEYDWNWRKRELILLTNQLGSMSEDDKEIYCKALLVMLYSHFEGFCKYAFRAYIKLINEENIKRSNATEYIVASSLLDVFHDIKYPQNGNNCCDLFNIPSDETKFLNFFIRTHFIRKYNEILVQEVDIPEEQSKKIVDTKSNLSLRVLSNILYRLGLPYNRFDRYESTITNLLTRRGDIAHGEKVEGIRERSYKNIEENILDIISELIILLTEAARNRAYLKN